MRRTATRFHGVLTATIFTACGLDTMGASDGPPGTTGTGGPGGSWTAGGSQDEPTSGGTTASATTLPDGTTDAVTPAPGCGDGVVEGPEECDQGADNGEAAVCTPACTWAVCGDGFVSMFEACDDGNAIVTDACVGCEVATCGDGFVFGGVEACDEGAMNGEDQACTHLCEAARCGDGFVWAGDEECDDGAANGEDQACTHLCTVAACGDGFVQAGEEACDEANPPPGSTCAGCQAMVCLEPWGDCTAEPGCETNTNTSGAHCGVCGKACSFLGCQNGACKEKD